MEITNIYITVSVSVIIGAVGYGLIEWIIKKCINHKLNKNLAIKTTQYQVLIPSQQNITEELYSQILKLQKSTKLVVELINVAKQQIEKSSNNIKDKNEDVKFEFAPVFVNKETKSVSGRVFTYDEIVLISNYRQLQSEVKEYIEQKVIFMPEDIINNINAVLFLIEVFTCLNYPKELIQKIVQSELDTVESQNFAKDFENIKTNINFDDSKVIEIINGLLSVIQTEFRKFIGVEER